MALTTPRVQAWIYAKLTADATLMALGSPPLSTGVRVYPDTIPQGVAYPAILFAFMTGEPVKAIGNIQIWTEMLWIVRATTVGSTAAGLEAIANRIDTLLDGASGTAGAGTIFTCAHDQERKDVQELPGGNRQHYLGRYWRIQARTS